MMSTDLAINATSLVIFSGFSLVPTVWILCANKKRKVAVLKDKQNKSRREKLMSLEDSKRKALINSQRGVPRKNEISFSTRKAQQPSLKHGRSSSVRERSTQSHSSKRPSRKSVSKRGSSSSLRVHSTQSSSKVTRSAVLGIDKPQKCHAHSNSLVPSRLKKSSKIHNEVLDDSEKSHKASSRKKSVKHHTSKTKEGKSLRSKRKSLRRRLGETNRKRNGTSNAAAKSPYGDRGDKSRLEKSLKKTSKKTKSKKKADSSISSRKLKSEKKKDAANSSEESKSSSRR